MDFQLELEILLKKLNNVEFKNEGILDKASRSIRHCRNALCKFKKEVFLNGFKSLDEEIYFFKNTKQIPLVKLIYFTEIRSFELQFPKGDKKSQRKFIKRKTNKLNRFFLYNLDFGQYVDSEEKHFDKEYYTRNYLDSVQITTSKFYFQDPDFCTSRDMLLGKFQAYKLLISYLDEKVLKQKQELNIKNKTSVVLEKIPWPFTNADWVELIYALYAAGLNNGGKLSIIKLSQLLQEVFDYRPSQKIYKVYQNLKSRKQRNSFLNLLSASLIAEMNKSDE